MSQYKSNSYPVDATQEQVFNRLSNPTILADKIEALPDDVKEKLSSVKFNPDSIVFNVPPVGEIKMVFSKVEAPNRLTIAPESSPVPFSMSIDIAATADGKASLATCIDVELNFFMKQMVGNKLNDGVDKIAEMLARLPYGE
mgnify:CR=1 FL=1